MPDPGFGSFALTSQFALQHQPYYDFIVGRPDRRRGGRYQTYYLHCFVFDKYRHYMLSCMLKSFLHE